MNESCSAPKIHALPLTVTRDSRCVWYYCCKIIPGHACIITCDNILSKILSEYLAETTIKTNIFIKIAKEVIEVNSRFSAG
jgi:hypothetical protein